MTEIETIKNLLKDRNLQEVSKGADISTGKLYKFADGSIKKPSYEIIMKLKSYLKL